MTLVFDGQPRSLARRLVDHLATLDLPEGTHLIEQVLADALGVSRTPIRRALAECARAGILYSEPYRGYYLALPSRSLFTSRLEFEVEDVGGLFDRIALDRLSGQLGDVFSESEIAARYDVSSRLAFRTLQTLSDEKVIEATGKGSWGFNPFLLTREASDASYAFRLVIEPQIPLLPTFTVRRDLLRRCRDEHTRFLALAARERTGRLAFRVDALFHDTVASFGNNPFFTAAVAQQNRQRQLLEYRDSAREQRVVEWVHEHLDILDAINAGPLTTASALMTKHLEQAIAHRADGDRDQKAGSTRRERKAGTASP